VIEFDVIPTPIGPCTAQMEKGLLIGLHLGERAPEAGRRTKLTQVRRWLADWFRGRPVKAPLKVEGTDFMRRVYRVVQRIPAGETWSYGEVAAAAGRPGAARAVGSTLRRNRICLFVPCHRVVAAAGLGGFTSPGGLAQKQALLDLESRR
jgi:methylated-DNA-[protein]-cysteine S-methyltransferase